MFVGDMGGKVRAIDTNGTNCGAIATGGFVYGSPVIANGHVYIASWTASCTRSRRAGRSAPKPIRPSRRRPTARPCRTPAPSPSPAAPPITPACTAVNVAVKNKATGQWWNAPTPDVEQDLPGIAGHADQPRRGQHQLVIELRCADGRRQFVIQASAVDNGGQHDPLPASISITVAANGNPPDTTIISPVFRQVFNYPLDLGQRHPVPVRSTHVPALPHHHHRDCN